MKTPIADFVQQYITSDMTRFHMPGHKGHVFFGCEPYDITEISGADVLHHGDVKASKDFRPAGKADPSGGTHYCDQHRRSWFSKESSLASQYGSLSYCTRRI